jgi:uncharacterized protein (TIGR03000 family)
MPGVPVPNNNAAYAAPAYPATVGYAPAAPAVTVASATDVPVAIGASAGTRAQVLVRVPADAKLFADGQATALAGAERVFSTPELTPGRDFQYTLKIEYVDGTETKTASKQVMVRAGHRTVVDFTEQSEKASSPVTVNLPAKAKLFVDGVATPATGGTHTFRTPELTKGKAYVYSFRAEVEKDGKTEIQSKDVTFTGGESVVVDFTAEAPGVRTAAR